MPLARRYGFILLFIQLSRGPAYAQNDTLLRWLTRADSLMALYTAGEEKSNLYLHLDKTIYSPNEIIWFSVHIRREQTDTFRHRILYVILASISNDSLVRASHFLLDENRGYGDILIPNFTPTGDYRLIAYTDKMVNEKPALIFQQLLQIRHAAKPPYSLSLRVTDTLGMHPDSLALVVKYKADFRKEGEDLQVSYELLQKGKRAGKGKIQIGPSGLAMIPIHRNLASSSSLRFRALLGNTTDGKQLVELPVKYITPNARVGFYPESGSLIAHTPCRVAVEVLSGNGNPLQTSVEIWAGHKLIDSFATDKTGIGYFELVADSSFRYIARVKQQNGSRLDYPLPGIREKGYTMRIQEALADDSLNVVIRKDSPGMNVRLLLHNFRQLFWGAEIKSQLNVARFPINTSGLTDGIYALTLVNEALQPMAERLVMVYHPRWALRVVADKATYAPREKISLQLELMGDSSASVTGHFSLSCAEISRIDSALAGNILHAMWVQDQLDGTISNEMLLFANGSPNREKMNALLLTRGWRNYNWEGLINARQAASPVISLLRPGRGRIKAYEKTRSKPPYEIALFDEGRLKFIPSDSTGYFILPLEDQVIKNRRKIYLTPFHQKKEVLKLQMDTLPDHVQLKMLRLPSPSIGIIQPVETALNDAYAEAPFGIKILQEVVVGHRRIEKFVSKNCDDYICFNNVINCSVHPNGTSRPVNGENYLYRFSPFDQPQQVEYVGCNNVLANPPRMFTAINGIGFAKEFYKADYSQTPAELKDYSTTLFWNPSISLTPGPVHSDWFYCSDWPGVFRVVVEGLVNNTPVRAVTSFLVK